MEESYILPSLEKFRRVNNFNVVRIPLFSSDHDSDIYVAQVTTATPKLGYYNLTPAGK